MGFLLRVPLKGSKGFLGFRVLGVVISGAISLVIWIITTVTLLITLVLTTHKPPSVVRHQG